MTDTKPQVLKSIWNEKLHPEAIHAHAAVIRLPNGTVSGNWQNKAEDRTAEYRRADIPTARIAELEADREILHKAGIVEIAARNPNIMEYIKHWQARAEAAEAEREALKAENARLRDALSLYSCDDGCNDCPEHERDIVGCGWTARAALGKATP